MWGINEKKKTAAKGMFSTLAFVTPSAAFFNRVHTYILSGLVIESPVSIIGEVLYALDVCPESLRF